MTRWTVRNVPLDAIRLVQDLAAGTGASLGQALATAIRQGALAARQELKDRCYAFDLVETLERIQALQMSQTETLRDLCGSASQYIEPEPGEPR